jgi:hypothetical protein
MSPNCRNPPNVSTKRSIQIPSSYAHSNVPLLSKLVHFHDTAAAPSYLSVMDVLGWVSLINLAE